MSRYYYVATAVPALTLECEPELSFGELMELFDENLSEGDLKQVAVLRRLIDIYNLCSEVRGEPLDPRGNLTKVDIEEAQVTGKGIPLYAADFFATYESDKDRLRHLGQLIALFFREEIANASGFLREYLTFERSLRLVLTGLRAKELKRDVAIELQHEDPNDPIVAQILAQKDAEEFEPPEGFEALKPIFEANRGQPLELHRELASYRYERVEQMLENEIFSIGWLLGYMVELMIVERLRELEATHE